MDTSAGKLIVELSREELLPEKDQIAIFLQGGFPLAE